MAYTLTLNTIEPVTHDTYHLRFDRPEGFDFTPGQATELTLMREGWKDEGRPFTMTSMPEDDSLDFVIKSYPDHDGVTEQIPTLKPGDEVKADDPFGAISDQGAGVFIAGGAGITPFIPILRRRARDGEMEGVQLIFSNLTEADIILRDEWEAVEGLTLNLLVTDEPKSPLASKMLDADLLNELMIAKNGPVYICGPGGMVDAVRDAAKSVGVPEDKIITEDGW